jgi:hypothetical protein
MPFTLENELPPTAEKHLLDKMKFPSEDFASTAQPARLAYGKLCN